MKANEKKKVIVKSLKDVPDALAAMIRGDEVVDEYKDHWFGSNCGYPRTFRWKSVNEQIKLLKELLPDLGTADESIADKPLPDGAESWCAFPRFELIKRGCYKSKWPTSYNEAVLDMLELFKEVHGSIVIGIDNWEEEIRWHFHQTDSAMRFWQERCKEQNGRDILIVPVQFGLRYRNSSVSQVCTITDSSSTEVGLGVFAVLTMLLTHYHRMKHRNDLWITCPGDIVPPTESNLREQALNFTFDGEEYWLGSDGVEMELEYFGAATGFVCS